MQKASPKHRYLHDIQENWDLFEHRCENLKSRTDAFL